MSFNPEATVKNRTPEDLGSITPGMSKPEIAKALMEDMVAIPDSKVIFEEELGERGPDDGVVMFRTRNPNVGGNYSSTTAPEDETTRLLGRAKMGDAVIDLVQYVLPETDGKMVIGVVDKGKSCAEMLAAEEAAGRSLTVEEKKAIQARNTSFVEDGSMLTIGRGENSGLKLDDSNNRASRTHAKVVVHGDKVFVIDSSTNGTRWIGDADFMHVPNERNSGMTPTQAKELLSDTSPSLGSQEYSRAVVGHFEALSGLGQTVEAPPIGGESGQEGEGDGTANELGDGVPVGAESSEPGQAERIEQAEALVATAEASEPDMTIVASEAWGIPVGSEATKDADPVDEAVDAARRVLQEKPMEAESVAEQEQVEGEAHAEEASEVEKTPEEKIRDSCSSAESLMKSLSDPETPPELKRAVEDLVRASRESVSSDKTVEVWDHEVVPLIRRISGEQIDNIKKQIQSVAGELGDYRSVTQNAMRYLEGAAADSDPGYLDNMMSRLGPGSFDLRDKIKSGALKQRIAEAMQDQSVSGMRTMMGAEEVVAMKRKLEQRLHEPVEPEEVQDLYERYGSVLANGLEGMRATALNMRNAAEERNPNWKARRNRIEEMLTRMTAITRSEAVEGADRDEHRLADVLELSGDTSRRIRNYIENLRNGDREARSDIKREANTLGGLLSEANTGYSKMFGKLEDLQNLTSVISAMAADIR
jgi:hypothetical protein